MDNEFALTSLKCMSSMLGIDVIYGYYMSSLFSKSHQPAFCAKITNHTLRITVDALTLKSQYVYDYLALHSQYDNSIPFEWNYHESDIMLNCFLSSRAFKLVDDKLMSTKNMHWKSILWKI